ncbi:MAG: YhcH/YjgK/YiaL family protein [Candidatus Gastranaerophilales bacterium]|nr:YhcH/YjgK/YiaL family protein [Candidatus Gastranaerophilales bacterium]
MIIDQLKNAHLYYGMSKKIATALKFLEENNLSRMNSGRYAVDGDDIFTLFQSYMTKEVQECKWEVHRRYIDVQFILQGREKMGYAGLEKMEVIQDYDEETDVAFLEGEGDFFNVTSGYFVIFEPDDVHMPGIAADTSEPVKKFVVKIKI